MGWLYSWGKSLFDELKRIHVRASKIIYGLDWYKPSDKVLVLSKWPSVKGLCEYRLFMLAHDCFYSFFPVPIMKLFPKYELPFVTKTKYWNSSQVHLLQSRMSLEFSWQPCACNLKQKLI